MQRALAARMAQGVPCTERHAHMLPRACARPKPTVCQHTRRRAACRSFKDEWTVMAPVSPSPQEVQASVPQLLVQTHANGAPQPHPADTASLSDTGATASVAAGQSASQPAGHEHAGHASAWLTEPLASGSVDLPDTSSQDFHQDMAPQPPQLADFVAAAPTWRALHSVVVTRVSDPTTLTMVDVAALMQKIAQLATEVGADEPSREMRLQCRAVVGVAALAALHANAGEEYDGGLTLEAPQVSGMLCALGSLAARRLLDRRDMPREVARLIEFLVRRARRLSAAGQLGPNQLAGVLRAAALLCPPGVVDGVWLKEAELQLLGIPPGSATFSAAARASSQAAAGTAGNRAQPTVPDSSCMARLAHDSVAALMTAMTTARASRSARRWRPSSVWLHAFAEQACCSARLEEMDGHELSTVVHGLTELAWPTSSAPYVPTSDELAWLAQQGSDPSWPGSGEGPVMPTSAPLPPTLTRRWLEQVRAHEAVLVRNTVSTLAGDGQSMVRTQWTHDGPNSPSYAPATPSKASTAAHSNGTGAAAGAGAGGPEPHLFIQPCDLALLLVAYTRLGVEGFYPGRPPGLAPLPLESMFTNEAGAGRSATPSNQQGAEDEFSSV